jgi:hypothetical protein
MSLLFQRRFGIEHRAIPAATIREWISGARRWRTAARVSPVLHEPAGRATDRGVHLRGRNIAWRFDEGTEAVFATQLSTTAESDPLARRVFRR